MSAEFGQILPGIIQEQQTVQQEQEEANEACRKLRGEAENLLKGPLGRKHVYIGQRIMGFAMLPLTILPLAGELHRAPKRFLEISEASYSGCVLQTDSGPVGAMVMVNDGDPTRASRIQIGIWNSEEVMLLFGSQGVIAYTEDSPMFIAIEPSVNFHGTRFDRKAYKMHHSATVAEAEKYGELVATLKQPPPGSKIITSLPFDYKSAISK